MHANPNKLLNDDKTHVVVASTNRDKLAEYRRLLPSSCVVLGIKELANVLGVNPEQLDSKEQESDYPDIAMGKVLKIQEELKKHQKHLNLNNIFILGDDYGAACDALCFVYDEAFESDDEFLIEFDREEHIGAIKTSRQSLANQPAPGYFSHRIINAVGKHHGLSPLDNDFKKDAFELFAKELVYQAKLRKNFQSSATVAISYARGLHKPNVIVNTEKYQLIDDVLKMGKTGFDFDRVQLLNAPNLKEVDHKLISDLSTQEKDAYFVRGLTVSQAMDKIVQENLSKTNHRGSKMSKGYQQSHAITPIDGRYAEHTVEINPLFSEFALMKHRVKVEIEWFKALANEKAIKEVPSLSSQATVFLDDIVDNFSQEDFEKIQKHESVTRHDVKAVEYFLKDKFDAFNELKNSKEFIHFACTSADINNMAYALMLKELREKVMLPYMDTVIESVLNQAEYTKSVAMLAKTHGQAATPTTLGKEWANFALRLKQTRDRFSDTQLQGKMNGAVGTYGAHMAGFSECDWPKFSQRVINGLGLEQTQMTTQIESHDQIARFLFELKMFAIELKNLDLNTWLYISEGYFSLKLEDGQVGSSTMPHKINPINFENSEGNLDLLIGHIDTLVNSITQSRLQRDLTDSTKKRSMGTLHAQAVIAMRSFVTGMNKLQVNEKKITEDLENRWELLAEPIQTVMRRYDVAKPYEKLKALTQGNMVTNKTIAQFLNTLEGEIPPEALNMLKEMTPLNYTGIAAHLTEKAILQCRANKNEIHAQTPQVDVVVGTQWGDEGKGKITDLKASSGNYDIVARYNGGANAGHSLKVGDGEKLATHLMPSGILCDNVVNVVANGVVLDPWQLLKEINNVRAKGISVTGDNLKISDRCHIVLPYHKQEDALNEAILSKGKGAIGTTKKGIGPSYADKDNRFTAIRFSDLFNEDKLKKILKTVVTGKKAQHQSLAKEHGLSFDTSKTLTLDGANGEELHPYDADKLFGELRAIAAKLQEHKTNTVHYLNEQMKQGKKILVEGANAFQLDKDFGTYPYVTSSNASVNGIPAGLGISPQKITDVTGIVKAYTTRVGAGPFPTELAENTSDKTKSAYDPTYIGNRIREKGHEYGTTTGRPRRCGWLDLVPIQYAINTSGINSLSIMLLDVLAEQGKLKICTGYQLDGKTLPSGYMPADIDELSRCKPIYKAFQSFGDVSQCRSYFELPKNARDYLMFIEDTLGQPIEHISYGPERNQTLHVQGGLRHHEAMMKNAANQLRSALTHAIECTGDRKQRRHQRFTDLKLSIVESLDRCDFVEAKQSLYKILDALMEYHHKENSRISSHDVLKTPYEQAASMRGFFHGLHETNALEVLFGNDLKQFQQDADKYLQSRSVKRFIHTLKKGDVPEKTVTDIKTHLKENKIEDAKDALIGALARGPKVKSQASGFFDKSQLLIDTLSSYRVKSLLGCDLNSLREMVSAKMTNNEQNALAI
jgi:adenylosuccinate lyase